MAGWNIRDSAVFWPEASDPNSRLLSVSDHRMVHVDLDFASEPSNSVLPKVNIRHRANQSELSWIAQPGVVYVLLAKDRPRLSGGASLRFRSCNEIHALHPTVDWHSSCTLGRGQPIDQSQGRLWCLLTSCTDRKRQVLQGDLICPSSAAEVKRSRSLRRFRNLQLRAASRVCCEGVAIAPGLEVFRPLQGVGEKRCAQKPQTELS